MRRLEIVRPHGRARLERVPSGWSLDLVEVHDAEAAVELLEAARDEVAGLGGGVLRLWARDGDPLAAAAGDRLGFRLERDLHQLRRPLPADPPGDLAVRPFVVDQDEDAWLAVNNRAFHWHPEQGGWTREDLEQRLAEEWFDPSGFLLHEVDGRLVGFCWTKAHRDTRPTLGEIYVIAVDPAAGVRGLGAPLTLAGLDHLHRVDGMEVGMLYVDGTNEPGLRLYDRLGFTVHHTDTSRTQTVRPS